MIRTTPIATTTILILSIAAVSPLVLASESEAAPADQAEPTSECRSVAQTIHDRAVEVGVENLTRNETTGWLIELEKTCATSSPRHVSPSCDPRCLRVEDRSTGVEGILELKADCTSAGSGVGQVDGFVEVLGRSIPFNHDSAGGKWSPSEMTANGARLGLTATNGPGSVNVAGVPLPASTEYSFDCVEKEITTNILCVPFTEVCVTVTSHVMLSCNARGSGTVLEVPGVVRVYVKASLHNPVCDE